MLSDEERPFGSIRPSGTPAERSSAPTAAIRASISSCRSADGSPASRSTSDTAPPSGEPFAVERHALHDSRGEGRRPIEGEPPPRCALGRRAAPTAFICAHRTAKPTADEEGALADQLPGKDPQVDRECLHGGGGLERAFAVVEPLVPHARDHAPVTGSPAVRSATKSSASPGVLLQCATMRLDALPATLNLTAGNLHLSTRVSVSPPTLAPRRSLR